jgi:cation transporter-like permease
MSERHPDARKPPRLSRGGMFLIAALTVFLAAAIGFAIYGWNLFPGTEISASGIVAMILGVVFSVIVGGVLMGLVFWSHRKGYDR